MGSDYTLGVKGIGPVNAVEIVNSFPGTQGL
jgi:5'-3' exonuclease